MTQMLILTLFSRTLGSLTENGKRFSIFHYKNVYKFYAFKIKTDFRNMPEIRKFRRNNKTNQIVWDVHTLTFFLKKPRHLLKNGKRLMIFCCKNKRTYKFYAITIKFAFEISH